MNANARAHGPAEPHTRRVFAVECVGGCGRLVLERVGSCRIPWCAACKPRRFRRRKEAA